MTTPPDETSTRLPLVVERRPGGNGYDVLYVDGRSFCLADISPLHAYAMAASPDVHDVDLSSQEIRAKWAAVADFLDSADERQRRAMAAFPDEGADVPPPRRPAVSLRTELEVNGVQVGALVVVVPPSASDAATAVQDAARALHDGALAVLRVLAVEPTERAGAPS